ncbi:dihydroxyacetone kinase family protein [Leucobacter iarius]|uniref:Homodimeric dihydroxyacetone kinase n=1 Tax=Leucobacter iarius TaxID=333963 RepID=A0ABN2L8A2_9MICO
MRKIINDPADFVDEVLDGILLAHPEQLRAATEDRRALVRTDAPKAGRVGIVTGGGSGHLPFFLGYVGRGLCSAVAVGNVFSSPSSAQIHAASLAVDGGAGLLYLYGNYGGDVYNFDIAADLCRGQGIEVRTVLGADDVQSAPADAAGTRRGVAGLVLVYKVAGAMADRGAPLDEVARVAQRAADATRTMGVGLSPTILPAAGEATFALDPGEMEIGVGIHGERGSHRGPLESADAITDRFIAELEAEIDLAPGVRLAVLVNGLGATPLEELYVMYRRVHREIEARGATISYRLVGEYVTSLEMAGASLSIMRLDDELESLLHDPAGSPFFQQGDAPAPPLAAAAAVPPLAGTATAAGAVPVGSPSPLRALLLAALPRMSVHAEELRELDAVLGDGDLGITVSEGSAAAAAALAELPEDADARGVLRAAGLAFSSANPSTFAALVGGGLIGAADALRPGEHLAAGDAAVLLRALAARIAERGGAEPGDKTLLDVLLPVVVALEAGADADRLRAVAADAVAESAAWQSRRGRAAWQRERSVGQRDPGSVAVQRFVEELTAAP